MYARLLKTNYLLISEEISIFNIVSTSYHEYDSLKDMKLKY